MKQSVKATNAMEAKILTDKYIKWLSPKRCFKLFSKDVTILHITAHNISYKIGASAYYYGIECRLFCSEIIHLHILDGVIKYNKKINN